MRRGLKRYMLQSPIASTGASFKPIPDEEGTETPQPGAVDPNLDEMLQTDPR